MGVGDVHLATMSQVGAHVLFCGSAARTAFWNASGRLILSVYIVEMIPAQCGHLYYS